jgi:predicted lipid-binding transport protein (Tim44 family)
VERQRSASAGSAASANDQGPITGMSGFLDLTSLIFLVVAVAIFWRLRSVLGRRTGNERPPKDPFRRPPQDRPAATGGETNDNVVALPRSGRNPPPADAASGRIDAIAPSGSALNTALRAIVSVDRNFDADHFVQGAKAAYEMIVSAFAAGDRDTLKPLLASDVYDGFAEAIRDRESRGESMETTFVGIDKAEITEAQLKSGTAQVTVRFVSKLISVTRDKSGTVVDGDPAKVTEVTDVWTFAREVRSRDPNWKLIATEAES